MPQRAPLPWIFVGVFLSIVLPLIGNVVSQHFFLKESFRHVPVHSLVEAVGGLIAVAIAGILIAEFPRRSDSHYFIWMASALIGMGILDLCHAGVHPGKSFVWLHSTATFVGGALFACVWIPGRLIAGRVGKWIPWVVMIVASLFGMISCFDIGLPAMINEDEGFTLLAQSLNMGGGLGFLAAGVFFVRRFHRDVEFTDWLFALHTMLFGAAGLLFELSTLWDAAWWWWHILRLIAYAAAFVFAVGTYVNAEREVLSLNHDLTKLNEQLDQTVEERTAELRVSEERYELAVRGSTDGLWDWNLLSDEVFYSPRFKQLIGFGDDEFPNLIESFRLHLHDDDSRHVMDALKEHWDHRVKYDVEYRLRTKSGEYRWFRSRGQAIWDESGKPVRMAGSITDLTKRKLAESSLKHERFLFQTLFDHLPDAIYFKDRLGQFTRVTTSMARWLGAKNADEVLGKTDADFFPGEYAAEARADEQQLMETGKALIGKEEHAQGDRNQARWVSTTKVPLRDESGVVIGSFGISHDITDQKLAQERFRSVIEAAPNAMIVVDGEGKIQLVNASTEQMFGYTREELIDQSAEILVPVLYQTEHKKQRNQYLKHPTGREMGPGRELSGRRKNGEEFPVEIGLSPIQFNGESVVLSSINDVTKRKLAEEALVDAKDAAESANRAKSDFLANMSHEIRTPMNAIIGMTDLVLETEINRTQREYLTIVGESADSLLKIINQILDFSKIEAGRLELESLNFNLHEEVGDTLKILGHRAHSKQLELAWHIDQAVPKYLIGDAPRFRQVLINLVGNAIKFTDQGEVVVDIRRHSTSDSRVLLDCTVRDTGIGIPENRQRDVFDAFAQADSSTTRQFGGTGLGLAISSRIVQAMNGIIFVDSVVDEGTSFQFNVEFEEGEVPANEDQLRYPDLTDLPVVVVDDNATNRMILMEILENWGMDVVSAETGSQAIHAIEHSFHEPSTPPILISDVHMPEMDGFMLAQEIRSRESLRDVPIILLSSGGRVGDSKRCEELCITSQLLKPTKHSELLDAIIKAAGKSQTANSVDLTQFNASEMPKLKILLVEDGKANQILAKGMLKKWGHSIDVAEDGVQGVEAWQNGSYDLILMDVQMPVMDGMEATQRIRQLESQHLNSNPRIPIIAMTAHAMKGDKDRCLLAGMDDYVAKPFRVHDLHCALTRCLSGSNEPKTKNQDESAVPPTKLIDWPHALELVGNDATVLADVASASLQELPQMLSQLENSIKEKDFATGRRAAHTIKSTSRILGAEDFALLAEQAERASVDQDSESLVRVTNELRSLMKDILREIDSFLAQSP